MLYYVACYTHKQHQHDMMEQKSPEKEAVAYSFGEMLSTQQGCIHVHFVVYAVEGL